MAHQLKIPRLLIAGTASGVGKTTLTVGICQALMKRGLTIQPFKVGPDYIDPGYHTQVTGRLCRNLDSWLIPKKRLLQLFIRACEGADCAIIEGVMGLYDGTGATGDSGSTAELAKLLDAPVLLVIDASALSRSAAALVRGFVDFDRKVQIAGCLINRVGGPRHYALVKEAIEKLSRVPVLGYLPKDGEITLPERHLGLVPSAEGQGWRKILRPLLARVREGIDLTALLERARKAKPLNQFGIRYQKPENKTVSDTVPIGVAMDEAFHFYYPENLELLEDLGAEIVPWSPLKDAALPSGIRGLYIGGGFPEIFAAPLSGNKSLHRQIREKVQAGLPTYAECGGLMFLSKGITNTQGKSFPMVGVVPGEVRMTSHLQNFGYKKLKARRATLLARAGEEARGHEFHHSVLSVAPVARTSAYEVSSISQGEKRMEGYSHRNLLASYVHLHFLSNPRWAQRFVSAARNQRLLRPAFAGLAMTGVAGLAMTFLLSPAYAAQEEEPTRLEEVIVTATKAKTPAKEVTRAVTVIPAERLSVVKGGFVSQALSDVPETLVRRTGSIGRTTAVVVRGASAAQVHVTIDGAHVASPTLGSFDFNHLTPDNFERMEILRGPGSTLYGSDAMGGVINLVTKRGEGPMKFSYTQEFGGQETFREVGSLSGALGKWHLSGSFSRIDSDGLSQNDDYQNSNFSSRIGYDLTDKTKLDLSVRNIFAIVGIDDGAFRPDPNRRDRDRQTIATGRLETTITPWWEQMWRLSASIGNLIDNDPSNGGTEADSLSKLDTERYGAEWMNRFTPMEWDTLTVGFEFEDREANRRTRGANANFNKAQTTRALYLQNEYRPIDPLTLVTGARFFRESSFGSGQVLDASLAYFVTPWNLKLRGGWGQGFRAPSLNELFFPNFGNLNLAPEKSRTSEFGAEQVLLDERVEWSATAFRTDFKDLIQTVRLSATRSEPQNVGQARTDGVELELKVKPWKPWTVSCSYTHLEANERPSQEELLRIPKNTVGFRVGLSPSQKWEAGLEGLLVSSREESSATNTRNKTKGYLKFDLFGEYRLSPWAKGYFRVENLTDRRYQEVLGFPAAGTVASVGITVEK